MCKTAEIAACIGVSAAGLALSLIEKNAHRATCLLYKHKDLWEYPETCIYKWPTDTTDFMLKIADVSTCTDSLVSADANT